MIHASVDLLVVGGGINGVGVARDAAGRGLSVLLVEANDLGSATSSASSKLIHGGLRYLEQFEFRLVAEALREREILLRAAPHLVRPMRFVMPHVPALRPAWLIRAGLYLYDLLARRQTLPGSAAVDFLQAPYSGILKSALQHGYAYSDCQVDDARLVIATARSAASRGAQIRPRTKCTMLRRDGLLWRAGVQPASGATEEVQAKMIVNVAGPWTKSFLTEVARLHVPFGLRLVQGSHIIVPRLYEGTHAYILQNDDRRVIFACPYESHYTLIGTTDVELPVAPAHCTASAQEVSYLCRAANRYFCRTVTERDVVHSYAGIRPLFDDGAGNPSRITRNYVLRMVGDPDSAGILSVFGGKITTYRRLAEEVVDALQPWFPQMSGHWTAESPLDGGDLGAGGLKVLRQQVADDYPWLSATLLDALVHRHGGNLDAVLAGVESPADLGPCLGAELYAREIDWFMDHEWAETADDVLWRRTKYGLHLTPAQQHAVAAYMAQRLS